MEFRKFFRKIRQTVPTWAIVAAFVMLFFFAVFSLRPYAPPRQQPPPPPKIADFAEQKRRVDELCRSLPVPDEFYLVEKQFSHEKFRPVTATYLFASPRSEQEIYPIFTLWFGEHGWHEESNSPQILDYRRADQKIKIFAGFNPVAKFSVECSEEEITEEPR